MGVQFETDRGASVPRTRGDRNPLRKRVVFVTYNGLLDPLGPSQILPYVERLHRDWPVHIESFERPERLTDEAHLTAMVRRLSAQSIGWTRLRYHKWPSLPATAFDLFMGVARLQRLLRTRDVGLIHARGYVPMAIATRATRSVPVLFDIRGLQAEEYVDGGVWKEGELKWRLAKASEKRFFRRSAGAVVLTENILPYVRERFAQAGRAPPVAVIPCCVDLTRFQHDEAARQRRRAELGIGDQVTVFVYSGSIGTWYMPDDMARFVRVFRDTARRDVCLLWMVNNDESRARKASHDAGLSSSEIRTLHAAPSEVPSFLSAADAALALIRPCFSKRSSSPTKYAECLAMGLPVLICRDVGDGAKLAELGGAVSLDGSPNDAALAEASAQLVQLMQRPRDHFRRIATMLFDIDDVALPAYRQMYETLIGP